MALFGSDARSDVKLGFWIGVGLLLLMLVITIIQLILGRVTKG
jgi:hypothetical protein